MIIRNLLDSLSLPRRERVGPRGIHLLRSVWHQGRWQGSSERQAGMVCRWLPPVGDQL